MSVYGAGRYLLETKLATPDTGGKVSDAITSHFTHTFIETETSSFTIIYINGTIVIKTVNFMIIIITSESP